MSKYEEQIFSKAIPQMPLMFSSVATFASASPTVLTASAALLSLAVPSSYSGDNRTSSSPEAQVVLMQCVSKSMPGEIIKRELREQLRAMESMPEGWIEGALPISRAAIAHVEELLELGDDMDFYGWELAPYINGTILMHYNTAENISASINIAGNAASGLIDCRKMYFTIEETDFNVKDIYNIVWRLSLLNKERVRA